MLASDVEELDALIAADLFFTGPDGATVTKPQDLEAHRSGASRFHDVTLGELEIRVWTEAFALASARVFVSGVFSGQAFVGHCRYTRVWRKGEGGWQIAAGNVSVVP